jgi:hypothetical protein
MKIMGFLKSLAYKLMFHRLYRRVDRSMITTEKDTVRVEVPQVKPNPEVEEKVRRLEEMGNELTAYQELLRWIRNSPSL